MELGQWVLVLAEVVTAREYQDIFHGKSGEKVYYTQGRYKKRLFDEDRWEVIHRPMDPAPMSGENVCLMRRTFGMPRSMMVIGRTWRATGQYVDGSGGNDDYRPPYLQVDKRHPVLLLRDRLRWQTPVMALERDVVELPDRIAQLEEQVAHLEYKLPDRIAQLEEQVAHLEYELRWLE